VLELLPSAFSALPTRRRSNERWFAYTLSVFLLSLNFFLDTALLAAINLLIKISS
jgi:hypothetical protein